MNEQKNNEILIKAMMAESQTEAIKIYCEETAKHDTQLAEGLKQTDKDYDKCWSFIMAKAKSHLSSKSGHVMPSIVFGWAVHYFTESNDDLEKEVGKISSKEKTTTESKQEDIVKKTQIKKEANKKVGVEVNNPGFERMSIFDLMPDESENCDVDEVIDDLEEEEDDE